MLNWSDLSPESETKKLLLSIGSLLDDYEDAATMIDIAYEKFSCTDSSLDTQEIEAFVWYCFSAFLKDHLQPGNLKIFGDLIKNLFSEMETKNIPMESLGYSPRQTGRPNSVSQKHLLEIIGSVRFELKSTKTKSEAYDTVAKSYHKSPDTIRRYYERWVVSKNNGKK